MNWMHSLFENKVFAASFVFIMMMVLSVSVVIVSGWIWDKVKAWGRADSKEYVRRS